MYVCMYVCPAVCAGVVRVVIPLASAHAYFDHKC